MINSTNFYKKCLSFKITSISVTEQLSTKSISVRELIHTFLAGLVYPTRKNSQKFILFVFFLIAK